MSKIEEKIEKIVTLPINSIGYEVYDITYRKEGKDNYLTIFIDSEQGISLNDCEKVNNEITDLLDEKDIIKEPYFLEISSPGIERVLRKNKHLRENIGNEIYIKSFTKINEKNGKEITGILERYNDDTITLKSNDETLTIQRKDIALIKKVFQM